MIWCTILNPSLDVIHEVEAFEKGSTCLDCGTSQLIAGKGLNVARMLHSLGEDAGVAGIIPECNSEQLEKILDGNGIHHWFLKIPGTLRINTSIVEKNSGVTTHFTSQPDSVPSRIQHDFMAFAGPHVKRGDYWCFSGNLPVSFDTGTYGQLIDIVTEKGAITLLDTRGTPLVQGVRAKPVILKPNLSELEEYFGEQIKGVHHIALKGKRLLDMGLKYIFISLGEDGMIALHKNDCLLCSAPAVENVIDTVGCGDALVAGILAAQKRRFSFTETCRMAVACGTAKSTKRGRDSLEGDTVWQLMEDVKITSI